MTDSNWRRFLGVNRVCHHGLKSRRSEAALQEMLKEDSGSKETHTRERARMTRLPSWQGTSQPDRGTTSLTGADSVLDEADKEFINASQQVWRNPSIDQVTEALRAAMMMRPNEPLPAEYRPHVLLLCEFYGTRHNKIAKLESQLSEAQDALKKETERHEHIEERWIRQDARYKAEVKRLEMFIHQTSNKGMEAVVLARAGSLIRTRPGSTSKGPTTVKPNLTASIVTSDMPRTRTTDTSNEIRLSNAFRKLEGTKSPSGGTRRSEAQVISQSKTRRKHRRIGQHSRDDSISLNGPATHGTVNEPPNEGSPEQKCHSTEKTPARQEVGVVSQPIHTEITGLHEHEHVGRDRVLEKTPDQSNHRGHTRHRRQFSFVPGDDTTVSGTTDWSANGSTPSREFEVEINGVDTNSEVIASRHGQQQFRTRRVPKALLTVTSRSRVN
ncbi:uncharacterized protein B0J16DRAFT_379094 [Fusarium flagelliforme]|uniref:Uncharacterized protein n=1 Tax=Fusarium flagelliforme TaxID=2675880 RepID=A0A395N1Y7_9HYPO|nr:uncharacterized protein B0J16DRAFT_379094 [Fusarium flagelliforme]KAH7198650.1 hypothetical protein B0J16DRAFT_379094 [Fusarium flagelliforme]RFN54126.1 hypothetical protein FIE12Z_1615 [Fusarium flagelliforme]